MFKRHIISLLPFDMDPKKLFLDGMMPMENQTKVKMQMNNAIMARNNARTINIKFKNVSRV